MAFKLHCYSSWACASQLIVKFWRQSALEVSLSNAIGTSDIICLLKATKSRVRFLVYQYYFYTC